MKDCPNCTFLKSLARVCFTWMRCFQDFWPAPIFMKFYVKTGQTLISSTSPFELWSNQNRHLIWSSLAAFCGVVLSPPQHHPGHPWHVHHLFFRTPLLGAETMSSFLAGGREPSKVLWERLVVFGHKRSAGEETSHQNLSIRNWFWSTYLKEHFRMHSLAETIEHYIIMIFI